MCSRSGWWCASVSSARRGSRRRRATRGDPWRGNRRPSRISARSNRRRLQMPARRRPSSRPSRFPATRAWPLAAGCSAACSRRSRSCAPSSAVRVPSARLRRPPSRIRVRRRRSQLRLHIEPAPLQIQQQCAPVVRTFPCAIGESDQFLAAFWRRADDHENALLLVFEPRLQVNAIGPDEDVASHRQIALCHCA